jgi:hypothetical protein
MGEIGTKLPLPIIPRDDRCLLSRMKTQAVNTWNRIIHMRR